MRAIIFLLLLTLLGACAPAQFHPVVTPGDPPQLVVRGEGRVEATPDQLQLRLGVITSASDADQALDENNRRMAAVVQQLSEIGVNGDELETSRFQILPDWSLPPRPTPANWERQIIGYRVSNELLVKTSRVELAGRLLAAAQQAGANQIGGLQFTLADPESYRQQAITQATAQAVREAGTLAKAAGVSLGAVQSLTLDNSSGTRPQPVMMAEARMASVDSVPVASGKIEVTAAVTIVYRLAVEN